MQGFEVDPWELRWHGVEGDGLPCNETLFALSNGYLGLRANLEEGEPIGEPGTYLNGVYELRELPHAEVAFGYPESSQTIINVTDGKIIRLLVGDEQFDMRYGKTIEHSRVLDMRAGLLKRTTVWESPTGRRVTIRSERLVSFTNRSIAAMRYEVQSDDAEDLRIVLQSDLLANQPIASRHKEDPRLAAIPESALVNDFAVADGNRALLVHHTRKSGRYVAAGMDHLVELPDGATRTITSDDDLARLTIAAPLAQGETIVLTKFIGYGWSSQRSVPALRAQVDAALAMAMTVGWDRLVAEQREYLDQYWYDVDIEIDGDPELQQAIRFALFHVLQAGARCEGRSIGAKALTGSGYDGHTFWDTETFVLPMLTYTRAHEAREVLRWRHSTLDKAKDRAIELGQRGAMFPWRTVNGDECSGYWPAGTAAVHLTGDIAMAVAKYVYATGDVEFEKDYGLELLVECARLWLSLGHFGGDGRFRIDGITGPDEYTAVVNNNAFTNLAAKQNLLEAAAACKRHPDLARGLGVKPEEIAAWENRADRMTLDYNDTLGVHEQSENFTALGEWDFEASRGRYPLLLNYPYFELYRKQVVKQADLVLALYLFGDAFTLEEKQRNFDYYEQITCRDSSLSGWSQGVVAAEVGYVDLAFDYIVETSFMDLRDLHGNTSAGMHLAAMAGTWLGIVAGLGGMRDFGGHITFAPRLPTQLSAMTFRMVVCGSKIVVAVDGNTVTYTLTGGDPIELSHHGEAFTLTTAEPVSMPIPELAYREPPEPPVGCERYRRG
ncbi:glycoside hydrolase family 65 protein [Gordonia sp. NPDC003429]